MCSLSGRTRPAINQAVRAHCLPCTGRVQSVDRGLGCRENLNKSANGKPENYSIYQITDREKPGPSTGLQTRHGHAVVRRNTTRGAEQEVRRIGTSVSIYLQPGFMLCSATRTDRAPGRTAAESLAQLRFPPSLPGTRSKAMRSLYHIRSVSGT